MSTFYDCINSSGSVLVTQSAFINLNVMLSFKSATKIPTRCCFRLQLPEGGQRPNYFEINLTANISSKRWSCRGTQMFPTAAAGGAAGLLTSQGTRSHL